MVAAVMMLYVIHGLEISRIEATLSLHGGEGK